MITKAEVLWTYKCARECFGCSMNTGEKNSRSIFEWTIGIQNLKQLGCSFVAVYGAEPLDDFHKLPHFIKILSNNKMAHTLITAKYDRDKLKELYRNGLESLSTSYDYVSPNYASSKKTAQALEMLTYFKKLGSGVKNVAAIACLTKMNIKTLADQIPMLSDLDIHFFFDILHWNRGHLGTKCSGSFDNQIHLSKYDLDDFKEFIEKVMRYQSEGYLVNLDNITAQTLLATELEPIWNCSVYSCFPSWLTIAPDGSVFPCDDFKFSTRKYDMLTIQLEWGRFANEVKQDVMVNCSGCLWTTHIQAHSIKMSGLDKNYFIKGDR